MAEKKALRGFDRLSLFPVIKNTDTEYSVGERISLPNAQSMSKDVDSSSEKIYADDMVYLDLTSWNGINSTIVLADMTFEMMAELGFGEWDDIKQEFAGDPQGKNKEFAVSFRCLMANGEYRMFKWYSFTVSRVSESGTTTKGSGGGINAYNVVGMFTKRKLDGLAYVGHDGTDVSWLDAIESPTP